MKNFKIQFTVKTAFINVIAKIYDLSNDYALGCTTDDGYSFLQETSLCRMIDF